MALRVAWEASFGDLAVGFFRGRDSVPQISGEVIPTSFDTDDRLVNLVVNLRYPEIMAGTFELRGPLFGGVSGWVDAALVLPSRTEAFVSSTRLKHLERLTVIESAPDDDVVGVIQDGEPYVTGVVGVDVTLPGEVYLNAQYLHGFLLERDRDELHDYGLVALRYPAVGGVWRVQLRAGAELGDTSSELGWLAQARGTVMVADHVRAAVVVAVQDGTEGTTLRRFRDLSEMRLELGVEF